jgi:hypothetical protein
MQEERAMRYNPIAIAVLSLVTAAACSRDEREASFVSEAQAASPRVKDYGWRPSGDYVPAAEDTTKDYD